MDAIHNGRGDAHASAAAEEPQDQENGGINKTLATVVVVAAVGAVVTEGVHIPPDSLVMGVPGKVKRTVTPLEIEMNRYAAEHYVENAKLFIGHDPELFKAAKKAPEFYD